MRSDEVYLKHILDEINFLFQHTKGITFVKFEKNEVLKRACARSLEIIGEATKNISSGFKTKYKQIDWRGMAGMRDRLIHHYFGVNWEVVWEVLRKKLPELRSRLESISGEIKNK